MAEKEEEHFDDDGVPQIVESKSDFERVVEDNKVPIVAGLCLIMLASAAWFVFKHLRDQKTYQANTAFTSAKTVEDYNLVIDDHGGSTAGGNAYLAKAQAMVDEDRTDEAHQVLRKFIEQYGDHPRHAQGLLALGTLLEESGQSDAAEVEYRNVLKQHPDSELAPYAKLRIGDLKWAQGKEDEARIIYEEIPPTYPRTGQPWIRKIDERLRLMGVQESAAATTPEPTEAPTEAVVELTE